MAKDEIGPNRAPHGSADQRQNAKSGQDELQQNRSGLSGPMRARRPAQRADRQPGAANSAGTKPALAVALSYKDSEGKTNARQAPRVTATGRGSIAEQIVAIAFAKGVPVREDADLAQILATVDVDAEIPTDALSAVAEILSYLYRLNRQAPDGDIASGPLQTGQTTGDAT
ncbi:EscU/YscU/HrcU family type III secretion system export apparatus switch protein [Dongia soli]|uniref:EscU/YscU/HrcU family type III secretion system export apparatus switch protein n=1 Tax=Dongia soli TaxID=600628 RepID=A0ABU5E942_9PROT|nr:EscU/YscU/HrcU family type III secretion system export apparatus switch protein [Dongia soli]MDY0882671.1 EscU/YscU/HrcU family type III secretion system export apparatus switch protein [Dongia soli]